MEKSLHSEKYRRLLSWLKKAREDRCLTIRQLAEILGESHAVIGKIEIGERRLDVGEYIQICAALGLNPEEGMRVYRRR